MGGENAAGSTFPLGKSFPVAEGVSKATIFSANLSLVPHAKPVGGCSPCCEGHNAPRWMRRGFDQAGQSTARSLSKSRAYPEVRLPPQSEGFVYMRLGPRLRMQFMFLVLVALACPENGTPVSGGWELSEHQALEEEEQCTVDRRTNLTYAEFIHQYAFSRPVILQRLTNNSLFQDLCSKEKLLAEFGDFRIRLSTANTHSYQKGEPLCLTPPLCNLQQDSCSLLLSPDFQPFPFSTVDLSFQEYVEQLLQPQDPNSLGNDTLYFFGDNNFTEWGGLFQHYSPPPFRLLGTTAAYSFGIAGAGSGVPFHWHGPGYSEVIFGRKRWFLYPPEKRPDFHPNKTTLAWLRDTYPALPIPERPLQCTVQAGAVLP
ncbi:jmjC domain-containing protein 8 isoform X2 [Dromiciops gliroides]|uniref:jmjC domain-containing protein 8 isoform X2 n=1 Tax=Dromiciops gliroides TaxID=33562 RepID=UPI001CC80EC0|nr:jmjC domain-containing protein 8 isoform X2 [Dromiciops gliroides]